jgi:soluble cytochrome b562
MIDTEDLVTQLRRVSVLPWDEIESACTKTADALTALQSELAAVRQELEREKIERQTFQHGHRLLERQLEEARKPTFAERLAAAQQPMAHTIQDAERYRFLRDHAFGQNGHLALLPPEEMDAAIDAARQQSS